MPLNDVDISRLITRTYFERLLAAHESDVLIVGAGPAGLTAAGLLAAQGRRVTVLERKLAPGGGIWGGGMLMPIIVLQEAVVPLLDQIGIAPHPADDGLYWLDANELACALGLFAIRAGATLLNFTSMEDVRVEGERLTGLVVNSSAVGMMRLHVDPITLGSKAVIDVTGHDAEVATKLQSHGFSLGTATGAIAGEGPMNADEGERFVVEHTGSLFPGLYVAGMAVCAVFGGARMGPIFGGMLLSGQKAAELVSADLDAAQ